MDESLRIEHLEWDDWNLDHIQKHGITQSDAESVVWEASIAESTYKNRWLILGPRGDGRILALVVGEVPNQPGRFYPFSARPASRKERRMYEERTSKGDPHG